MTKRSLAAALAVAAEPEPASKKPPSRRGKRAWVVYLHSRFFTSRIKSSRVRSHACWLSV